MAATENIGLVITLGGTEKVINSVREFARAIKQAQDRLLTIGDEGSAEFKNLQKEIDAARFQLKEFKEDAQGTKVTRELRDFIEVGSSIASVFAGATAALQLFGVDSEQSSKAAAAAQNLLTIAVAGSTIAQNKDSLSKAKNTIVTIANTAATQGLIAATRALYAVMIANPLTAILVVLGALATAYTLLADNTNDASAAEEAYQKQLEKTQELREFQLELLRAQGATEEQISEVRRQNAERDLANARVQLNFLIQEGASQKQINEQLNIILKSKRILLLDNAKQENQNAQDEKKNAELRKKQAQERNAQLLQELRLLGDLRRIELDRITQGVSIELPPIEGTLEQQNEYLKGLAGAQDEYNAALEEYSKLTSKVGPADVIAPFLISKETQNAIKINRELIKSSFELAGIESETNSNILRDLLITQKKFLEGSYDNVEGYKKNQRDLLTFEKDFIKSFVETQIQGFEGSTEQVAEQRKILTEQAKVVFSNLIENGNQLIKVNAFYEEASKRITKLSEENAKLSKSTEVLNGFLRQNAELLTSSFTLPITPSKQSVQDIIDIDKEIATGRYDVARKFATDIEFLEYTLLQNGIDIRNASYEEKLKLLKNFLEKEVQATEDAEAKKQKAQQKTIDNITSGITAFQSVLNSLQQTTTEFYQLRLEQLRIANEKEISQIDESTKRGVELRLEAEQIYNEKKKQLEKQAAIASLRISFAQSLANTAEAITKAFTAGPVVGQIAAGIIAASSAFQTALIGAQIANIQSLQRGGIIKGQSGFMVSGPSHEFGGVKFQGGGVELEGGEAVINRVGSIQYGGLLNQINQLSGGRPLTSNTFDDSRIVEAIAKQRNEPIRAYVIEQDITSKQGITRRLEQLSQI